MRVEYLYSNSEKLTNIGENLLISALLGQGTLEICTHPSTHNVSNIKVRMLKTDPAGTVQEAQMVQAWLMSWPWGAKSSV